MRVYTRACAGKIWLNTWLEVVGINRAITVIVLVLLMCGTIIPRTEAKDLDEMISFSLSYELPDINGSGDAIISLAVHIEEGFPLSGKHFAIEQLLLVFKQLWGEEEIHENVVANLYSQQIPTELQATARSFNGTELILLIFESFGDVEDKGLLYFDGAVDLVYAETIPYYPDIQLTEFAEPMAMMKKGLVNFVLDMESDKKCSERVVNGNLVNISAAVLSYRSEYLVFPLDLGELEVTGHLLINPFNPYNGLPVRSITDDLSIRPGDIRYEYSGPDQVSVMSYLADGSSLRRGINLYSGNDFDRLFRLTDGLSEEDRQVAMYVFQLSHVIDEYYYEYNSIPDKVPQIESKQFASVSFINPFTYEPVKQLVNLLDKSEGDYFYYKTGENQYTLTGYGHNLEEIIKIQRRLGEQE